jgi:uncharacterized protein
MRMWLFAIGVAILGTSVLAHTGQIQLKDSIYLGAKVSWLSNLSGGVLFGIGMVLASGCGSKTLIRLGAGSLKALVVFIVMGVFAYMTLRGIFGVWRTTFLDPISFDIPIGKDIAALLAGALGNLPRLIVAGAIAVVVLGFCLVSKEFRRPEPLLGGLAIGLLVVALWFVSGHVGFVSEDPVNLQEVYVRTNTARMESFSFVAPAAYTLELLMLWSDKSRILTIGIATTLGMALGSLVYALATKSFRWEGFNGSEDTANHLVGAALMGVGGVTALGCTVGQGLSGISVLAVGSVFAIAGIVIGGWIGVRYQTWRVEKML